MAGPSSRGLEAQVVLSLLNVLLAKSHPATVLNKRSSSRIKRGKRNSDPTVDVLAGYLHSNDDWQISQTGPLSSFVGNDMYTAVDYYVRRGFAFSGRYDLLHQEITGAGGLGLQSTHDWTLGVNRTFTPAGNIIGRVAYSYLSGRDAVSATKTTDKLFQADVSFNF